MIGFNLNDTCLGFIFSRLDVKDIFLKIFFFFFYIGSSLAVMFRRSLVGRNDLWNVLVKRGQSSLRYQASTEAFSINGFECAGITAGLKPSGKPDMAMWKSSTPAVAAGCFTKNAFAAAPVILDREILKSHANNISTLVSMYIFFFLYFPFI